MYEAREIDEDAQRRLLKAVFSDNDYEMLKVMIEDLIELLMDVESRMKKDLRSKIINRILLISSVAMSAATLIITLLKLG